MIKLRDLSRKFIPSRGVGGIDMVIIDFKDLMHIVYMKQASDNNQI